MPLPPRLPWQHPWLTVEVLLRSILHEHWTNEQWRKIRKEAPALLKERERIRKARGSISDGTATVRGNASGWDGGHTAPCHGAADRQVVPDWPPVNGHHHPGPSD